MRLEEIVATDDERLAHLETTYRIAVPSDNAAARQTETILRREATYGRRPGGLKEPPARHASSP
jgi:hypothetical protein